MLTREKKQQTIDSVRQSIGDAKAVFLTNVIGMKSNDAVALRKQIRDSKGGLVVTRNSLISKAAEGTPAESFLKDLKGPHAVAFAFEDSAAVAKHLKNASDDFEMVEIKAGMLGGDILSAADLDQLANLPSREEMLGTLLATFMAPISAFARVMHAIGEQKAEGAPAEAAEETTTEEVTE